MTIEYSNLQSAKLKDVRRLARWLKIRGAWHLKAYRLRCEVDDEITDLRNQDWLQRRPVAPTSIYEILTGCRGPSSVA
jgi:hypothetical protein